MTAHVINRSAAERTLARQFAEQERRDPSPARAAAFARFAAAGLPTRRVEAWHYTDLRASMVDAAPILAAPTQTDIEAARRRLAGQERFAAGPQIVLLGGRFIAELSDPFPAGVSIAEGPVATVEVDDPLAALNEALNPSGCMISVAGNVKVAEPITVLHLGDETSSYSVYSRTAIAARFGGAGVVHRNIPRRSCRRPTSHGDDFDAGGGRKSEAYLGRWRRARPACRNSGLRACEDRGAYRLWPRFWRRAYAPADFCPDDWRSSQNVAWRACPYRRRAARRYDAASRSRRSGGREPRILSRDRRRRRCWRISGEGDRSSKRRKRPMAP